MRTMIRRRRGRAGVVLAGAGAMAALGVGVLAATAATDAPPAGAVRMPTRAAALEVAYIRASHLVPGLGSMVVGILPGRVRVGAVTGAETVVAPSLGYGQVTPYAALPPGPYTLTIRDPSRQGRGAPVLTGALTLRPGAAYTVTALGTTATARIRALQDDLTPAAPGRARVRVISAADVGAVQVAAAGGPVLVQDLGFARPTGYADVPARSWQLRVSATGTATSVTSVRLRPNSVYTLLVLPSADGAGALEVRTLVDAVGSARTPKAGPDTGYGGAAGGVSAPERG